MRPAVATFFGFVAFFAVFFLPAEVKLMAAGDATIETLPALLGARHLWEPSILLGYPLYADPNQQQFYPLAWFAALPHFFNAFAMAPYPIAAFGMWGFVRATTRSSLSGIVAGLVFALGGFMIGHSGHLMIVHPAAWAPYMLWAIEAQRGRRNDAAFAGGALAIGLCAVSGQPQFLAFALALAATYAFVTGVSTGVLRRPFAIGALLMFAVGIGIGCVQLIPEAALAERSTRATIDFAGFNALEIPLAQFAMRAIFPYALGASHLPGYAFSWQDLGTFPEDTVAVGIAALVLAIASLWYAKRDRRVLFWFAIAELALLLAAGDATPLSAITHAMPVFGLFRIPGRHAFEWTFALAVLAGYGARAIAESRSPFRVMLVSTAATLAIVAIGYVQFTTTSAALVAQTYGAAIATVSSPFANGALGFPLATGIASIAILGIGIALRKHGALPGLLVAAVVVDVGAFAFSSYWNWFAITAESLNRTPIATKLSERLTADGTRLAWLPGNLATDLAANLTTLWDVPAVDGYTPLVPVRASALLGITASGGVAIPPSSSVNLDVAGASIVATVLLPSVTVTPASPFAPVPIHFFFSSINPDGISRADLGLLKPVPATELTFVSELGDSTGVPQLADVASIHIAFTNGANEVHEILAGRDTSEFAFDRPDVRPLVKHARATIYAGDAQNHQYVARVPIRTYTPIAHVTIDWHYPSAALTIEKLSILDARTGMAHAFGALAPFYADPAHWQPLAIDPKLVAFRNERVRPHAWIASPQQAATKTIAASIRDGTFDVARRALVEIPVPKLVAPASTDTVRIDERSPTEVRETVTCASDCFVVNSDAFDKSWNADVDGNRIATFATDIDLRGTIVPAGTHALRFRFFPVPLFAGAFVSILSALAAAIVALVSRSRALRAS